MRPEMTYIYTVYEEGSFSKAAEKLYLTQPALSIAVQKIEKSIGMPLFDRTQRPFKLTDAGEIYIDTIKRMMALEKEQQQRINDIRELVTGSIRIGGSHYLNAYILPDVIASFCKEYPGVEVELVERSSFELGSMLAERKLDLTFSCNAELIQKFNRYEIFQDHILLAVPKAHPINQAHKSSMLTVRDVVEDRHLAPECPAVDLSAFSEMEYILLKKGNNLFDRANSMIREAGFEPKIKMNLSQIVTAYKMAAADIAATFVSDRLIKGVGDDSLVYYRLNSKHTTRIFYILSPRTEYTSNAVKQFVLHIQNYMRNQKS